MQPLAPSDEQMLFVRVKYMYQGSESGALGLSRGDILQVYSVLASGWADGSRIVPIETPAPRGWFPSNYVEKITEDEAAFALEQAEDATSAFAHRNAAFDQERSNRSSNDIWARLTGNASALDDPDDAVFSQGGDVFGEMANTYASSRSPYDSDQQSWDFWEPKMSDDGQIFYHNSRTGETSRDPPEELSASGPLDPSERSQSPNVDLSVTGTSRRPNVGAVPDRWVAKSIDGGRTTYYENTSTWETRWSVPESVRVSSDGSRSGSLSSTDLTQEMMSLDVLARSMQGSSLTRDSTETPPSSLQTINTTRVHQSTLSFDSDDSGIDTGLTLTGQKGKSATKRPADEQIKLPPELETLGPSDPFASDLAQAISDAVSDLVKFVTPTPEQAETEFDRARLASLASKLIAAVRDLLATVGMLDPAVRSASAPQHALSLACAPLTESQMVQLRPFVKKITSPLNKLVLSQRALWGTMWTTADEEHFVQENLLLLDLTPEDLQIMQENRMDVVKARSETEFQLRSDVAAKAEDVGTAAIAFIDRLSNKGSDLKPKRAQAAFKTVPNALLGPGAGHGGNWRSNGFDLLPTASTSKALPDIPPTIYTYPSHSLTPQSLAEIKSMQAEVTEDLVNLKGAIAGLVTQSNSKRASTFSTRSDLSAVASNGSTPLVLPNGPVAVAAKHQPKVMAQADGIARKLADLLTMTEDLDLASQLDLDFNPADVKALLEYAQPHLVEGKGKSKVSGASEQESTYRESIIRARQSLACLEMTKQHLYELHADLLISCQNIALGEVAGQPSGASYAFAVSQAQPPFAAPLNDFRLLPTPPDPLSAFLTTLAPFDGVLDTLASTLTDMLALVDRQSSAPKEMRTTSDQARARISMQRLSQFTFKSSEYLRDDVSEKGTVTNITRATKVKSTPYSFNASDQGRETLHPSTVLGRPANINANRWLSRAAEHSESTRPDADSLQSGLYAPQGLGLHVSNDSSDFSDEDSVQGSPVVRSPSKNKLKQIFGEEVPRDKNFNSVNYPAISSTGLPSAIGLGQPEYLQGDHLDELSLAPDHRTVKGGTLRALVARLTSHENVDSAYNSAFLMTYRSFTSPLELVNLFRERYSTMPPLNLTPEQFREWTDRKQKPIRIRTINIIKTWLEVYYFDRDAENVLSELARFAATGLGDSTSSQQLMRIIERRRMNGVPRRMSAAGTTAPPATVVPRRIGKLRLVDLDPAEVARQLTLTNSRFFQRITSEECLSKVWPKKLSVETPNIAHMIDFDNATTNWVMATILKQEDLKKRAAIIKHFIQIAEKCLKVQNFSTLMHIIAGLENSNISRLRRTWDLVNQRSLQTFRELADLMSPAKKLARYRDVLKTIGPPCVPFIGIFMTSWTFIGDGMPDFLTEKPNQINFIKRRKAAELLQQIELHQSAVYSFTPVKVINDFLVAAFAATKDMTNDRLWEMSLALEPREREGKGVFEAWGRS